MTKIALYHPWVYLKGGAEKVLLEYSKHTKHSLEIYCGYLGKDTFEELAERCVEVNGGLSKVNVKRTLSNSLKSLIAILTSKLNKNTDVLLISSEGFGDFFALFRRSNAKHTIAFVHTPLKLVYDEASLQSTRIRLGARRYFVFYYFIRPLYKIVNRLIWKRYEYVIANSSETKRRIIEGKLATEDKIKIVYPGANIPNKSTLPSIKEKYISKRYLIPGRIMIQKNIEMGIEAFLKANLQGATLHIAGHCDEKSQDYFRYLTKKYAGQQIKFDANPSDSLYESLFASAKCVIFTSVNEDWGIVPIEAMSFGTPVVCSNKGGPAESILHKDTGIICEANADSFAEGIQWIDNLVIEEYEHISKTAIARAKKFTWDRFTKDMDDIVEELVK